jgi:hypothetical protein
VSTTGDSSAVSVRWSSRHCNHIGPFTGLCLAIQDWLGDCDLGAEGLRQRKAAEFGNPAGGLGQLGGD